MTVEYDITLDRASLSLAALVLHGERVAGAWCLLPNWQMPAQVPNNVYASGLTHGATASYFTWQLAAMSGDVVYSGAASAAARSAAITELRAALGRLSYPLTVAWNAVDETWVAEGAATITPSPLDWRTVSRDEPVFSLSIPVRPLPESP